MPISSPIPVPTSAAAGSVPDPILRRSTFNSDAQAFLYWLAGQTGVSDANFAALVANAYRNAEIAYENAIAAAASAAANGATLWDASKNNYAMGDIVISPAALAAGAMNVVFICKLDTGGVHIDPLNDLAHWSAFVISGGVGGAVTRLRPLSPPLARSQSLSQAVRAFGSSCRMLRRFQPEFGTRCAIRVTTT